MSQGKYREIQRHRNAYAFSVCVYNLVFVCLKKNTMHRMHFIESLASAVDCIVCAHISSTHGTFNAGWIIGIKQAMKIKWWWPNVEYVSIVRSRATKCEEKKKHVPMHDGLGSVWSRFPSRNMEWNGAMLCINIYIFVWWFSFVLTRQTRIEHQLESTIPMCNVKCSIQCAMLEMTTWTRSNRRVYTFAKKKKWRTCSIKWINAYSCS